MDQKSRVLVVGGTGYLGKRFVKASLANGHPTYVLHRPEIGMDVDKAQLLLSFKEQGAKLVKATFSDHQSLVDAVKQVDVVISAISGVHIRSHHIPLQLNLVKAIKEAGNIKRFLPSEFGMDVGRLKNALEPGRITFDDKVTVRKAIEEAGIPYTYVVANGFFGYFISGLCEFGTVFPSTDHVLLHGDGNVKAIFTYEDDIATYTIKSIDDPRTINKTLHIRAPESILSQREVVEIWEKLIGKQLAKSTISEEDYLTKLKNSDLMVQMGLGHYYHIFFEGCLTNFELGENDEEATQLYPEVNYVTVKDYLKRLL